MYNNINVYFLEEDFKYMKIFKKIISALLVGCMLFSLCACHGKDEVALTIEGETITSALYLNALIDCDAEAKQRVDDEEAAAETEETKTEETEETDYYSKTLDGLSFVDYVKEKAIERCKEYIFFKKLVDAGTIKLEDEEATEAKNTASAYWSSYGYAYLYSVNGVAYETYEKAFTYTYYSNKYFEHLYAEGGEKEVSQKELKDYMLENYALAYSLTASYEENATDEQKADLKAKFEGYAKRIKNGEEFEKIYLEHNEINEAEHTHEETEDGPKLQHTSVLSDKNSDSSYANVDFDEVYDLKEGETTIIENEDKTGLSFYVKLNIADDEYYLKNLTDEILYILKHEEYQTYVTEQTKNYKVETNNFAINRFDVEDIDYSALESLYAAQQYQ